jgi:uncharacterized membrane protein YhaH (DUF805 family)
LRIFTPEAEKLMFAALIGPIAIFPACVFLEVGSRLLHEPLVPFISGHLFGNGDWSTPLRFAFVTLAVVFYPAVFFIGAAIALVLSRLHQSGIYGLVAAPFVIAFILSIVEQEPELVFVLLFCATSVALGCRLAYGVARRRL